jgi:hypothetical protein
MIRDKMFTLTLKKLVTLDKEGKLIAFPIKPDSRYKAAVWNERRDKNYINSFKDSSLWGIPFIINRTKEGVYWIIDGLHRISLLLEFGKSLGSVELESYYNKPICFTLFQNYSYGECIEVFIYAHSKEQEKTVESRNECIIDENRELIEKLLTHDFFKNCHILGNLSENVDWSCVEILLAFLQCDNSFKDGYTATLPSSLKKFLSLKIPYDKKTADLAISTLTLMDRVFKGKDYLCRAVDFCYMALFIKYVELPYDMTYENFTDFEYKAFFYEYDTLWYELEPNISLNSLAEDNLHKVLTYFGFFLPGIRKDREMNINTKDFLI